MNGKQLKNSILQLAIQGKLVAQNPADEPASELLKRIRKEKEALVKAKKIKKEKPLPEITDDEKPFEIPESWEWVRMSDISTVVRGGSPRPAGSLEFYEGPIPFMCVADITKDESMYVNSASKSIKEAGLKKTRMVAANTLLLSNSGATLGVPKINTFPTTFNDGIAAFLYLNDDIKPFVYWFFKSQTDTLRNINQGTAQPNLNTDLIKSICMPLPPLTEQSLIIQKIEELMPIVDEYDKAQTELDKLNAELPERLKKSVLQEAIQGRLGTNNPDDEPASELLKRIRKEKEALVKAKKIKKEKPLPEITDDEKPFEIPENWEWCHLIDICLFLSRGRSPKYRDEIKKYPVFAQKCNLKEGGISLEQARFIDPESLEKWDDIYKLRDDDVLVNSTGTGTVGRTRLFSSSCLGKYPFVLPDSHVSVVRTAEEIVGKYIFFCLNSFTIQEYFEHNLAGSTNQKELYIGTLGCTPIPLPPLAEQKRIVEKLDAILPQIENIK